MGLARASPGNADRSEGDRQLTYGWRVASIRYRTGLAGMRSSPSGVV
jgi:hypothetical protein